MNTLKDRLIYARTLRGLSQKELARRSKCAQSAIGNAESGERKSLRNLIEVARALECDPDWLYDGKGKKPLPTVVIDANDTSPLLVTNPYSIPATTALLVQENVVAYPGEQGQLDPVKSQVLELLSQLDPEGQKEWLRDLKGYVRGRRPHQDGSASAVAGQK